MTFKQKLFIKKYLEYNGNGTKTVLEVYNTTNSNSAGVIATQNLAKPKIKREIDRLFDQMY